MPAQYDIRQLTEDEYRDYLVITGNAYPGIGLLTPDAIDKRIDRLKQRMQDTRITMWGAFEGSDLRGVQLLYDLELNMHGHKVLCGGLGSVAVHLMHKKKHVAKELVGFYLDHYDQRRAPILALWPFRHQFYRNMGFGYGTRLYRYDIKPEWLPGGTSREHVRFLEADDIPAFVACLNRLADRRNGMATESERFWSYIYSVDPESRYVGFEKDGRLEGIMIYEYKPRGGENFIDNDIVVRMLCYENPDALAEMLSFLHSQLDQINRIHISTDDEDFQLLLSQIWNRHYRLIPPVYHESNVTGHGIMFRVMGVRRALEATSGHDFGGSNLTIRLNIADSFFPEHAGATVVAFENGVASVTEGAADVEVTMDIAEFSSMFMGAVRFRSLHNYGLATISDASQADRVDRTFACPERPVCWADF